MLTIQIPAVVCDCTVANALYWAFSGLVLLAAVVFTWPGRIDWYTDAEQYAWYGPENATAP
jgi:hypothetical protein